ncbi:MAG: hypothetical protein ACKO2N_15575, partial [Tabrizicola sp.]
RTQMARQCVRMTLIAHQDTQCAAESAEGASSSAAHLLPDGKGRKDGVRGQACDSLSGSLCLAWAAKADAAKRR